MKQKNNQDYEYGFSTNVENVFSTGKGISEEVVRTISMIKNEPRWMTDFRVKAYHTFLKLNNPKWGPDLSGIDFQNYTYFIKAIDKPKNNWEEVPESIKQTFEKIGIPEAERKFLAGVSSQFESEAVYHSNIKELNDQGIIYCDTDTALRLYPDLFRKYFATIVPVNDNKYAALNSAVWSGGSFIYVPKNAKLTKPIQSYFRMNSEQFGQFERTLIIVDEGAEINYVEGCTAPIYSKDSLHAAVVEVYLHPRATLRYTTIQNWSSNVINLVTKRAMCDSGSHMQWIDGNMGSGLNMKYPSCILKGDGAKGTMITVAIAGEDQNQDTGAKMIHLGANTSSTIISKSVAKQGGRVNYRGLVQIGKNAFNSRSHIECDTIIMDDKSYSDTVPFNQINNDSSYIEHEATVSKINDEMLFYLMARGLSKEVATEIIVMGFIEPFSKELPMEYAVELNRLIKLDMSKAIG